MLFLAASASPALGQEHQVLFDTSDSGIDKSITSWGYDLTWPSRENALRSLAFMGADEVDFVRVGFRADAPLVGGELTAASKEHLDTMAELALLAGAEKPWTMMPTTEEGVDPWFKSGSEIISSRWVQVMEATLAYYNHEFLFVEPFNEPDYGWGQGTMENLAEIHQLLRASEAFADIPLVGPSTLDSDEAAAWYEPIRETVAIATTHTLAGTFASYASFLQSVVADGVTAANPEAHNVVDVIIGAEYGMDAAMWWAAAERTRGSFVKACQGMRLGYAEDRPSWTAAAVYRAPSGALQGFVGASERMARTATYRFVAKDRKVFYDGYGPMRDYAVTIPGGTGYWENQPNAEKLVNITWGEDIQPPVDGRYVVVNCHSGKVLEVAGGSSADGANIQQGAYSNEAHQHWDIAPLDSRHGGDYSYFTLKSVHSGKSADVYDWSLESGGDVRQWTDYGNENQVWFFEYVEDGYFRIRSRWSGKYLEVNAASSQDGANVQQEILAEGTHQQWRLIPVGSSVEFEAPSIPTGLQAQSNDVSVRLRWKESGASDFGGYNVYRARSPEGPFDLIARELAEPSFIDEEANRNEVRYYRVRAVDRSLNRSDPSAIVATAPTAAPALVASLDFDADAKDRSGNGNHGEAFGGIVYESGKEGAGALSLNGADAYCRLPATVADFESLTVAAWIYWRGGPAGQRIFDFGSGEANGIYLTPRAEGAGTRLVILKDAVETVLDAPAIGFGKWVHVAVAIGAGRAELFIDGELASGREVELARSDLATVSNYLGRSQSGGGAWFDGLIDSFQTYNYAANADEIAVAAGAAVPPTPTELGGVWTGRELQLTWRSVFGADGYTLQRADGRDGPYADVAADLSSEGFFDADVEEGKTYYYRVAALNELGESEVSPELEVTALSPAEAWRLAHFGVTENIREAADEEDPDGDLVSNFLERAFGGDPQGPEWGLTPTVDESSPLLSLNYRKASSATDLVFTVQESSELSGPWKPSEGFGELVGEDGGIQWMRFERLVDGEQAVFLRLKVSGP